MEPARNNNGSDNFPSLSGVTRWFARFLLGPSITQASVETIRQAALLVGITGVSVATLTGFGLVAYWQNNLALGLADLFLALGLAINLADARRRGHFDFNVQLGVLLSACLFVYLYLNGGANQTTFVWYFIFPLVACFLLGAKKGAVATLLMTVPVLFMILVSPKHPFFARYSLDLQIRFLFAYLVVGTFAFLFKQSVETNRRAIAAVNENLERLVDARTTALTRANRELKREIEAHRKDRSALNESQERYRIMFEKSGNAIFLVDRHTGRYLDANPAAEQLTGRSVDAIRKLTTRDVTPESAQDRLSQMSSTNRPIEMQTVVYLRPDGSRRTALLNAVAINETTAMGVAHDITELLQAENERRELESRLQQVQKMEAIGTLAGGIAHDFNNILSAIIGYTELSVMQLEPGHDLQQNLEAINTASCRARDLVKQILTFSRKTEIEVKPVRVSTVVEEVLALIRATMPKHIDIVASLSSDRKVMGDPVQVHQLILNLCTNAGHAMRETGGRLQIDLSDAQRSDLPEAAIRPQTEKDPMVVLTVADSGCGMAPETVDRVFEPFFTTKEKGDGTGLGLSVVHGIVQNLGAEIRISSRLGEGSRFAVWMPALEDASAPEGVAIGELPHGKEHILLVDDEAHIQVVGRRLLAALGYRVTAVGSGSEALRRIRDDSDGVDLLVTDLSMPKMDGIDLIRQVKACQPAIPVIFCTGYLESSAEEAIAHMGVDAILIKPLHMDALARTVRRVLDRSPGSYPPFDPAASPLPDTGSSPV